MASVLELILCCFGADEAFYLMQSKHFWLPWQRNAAFFVFTSISVPAVHPIPENPFPLL